MVVARGPLSEGSVSFVQTIFLRAVPRFPLIAKGSPLFAPAQSWALRHLQEEGEFMARPQHSPPPSRPQAPATSFDPEQNPSPKKNICVEDGRRKYPRRIRKSSFKPVESDQFQIGPRSVSGPRIVYRRLCGPEIYPGHVAALRRLRATGDAAMGKVVLGVAVTSRASLCGFRVKDRSPLRALVLDFLLD